MASRGPFLIVSLAAVALALAGVGPGGATPPLVEAGGDRVSWEYGIVEEGHGAGRHAWTTSIKFDYRNLECSWLQNSQPIPGTLLQDPTLRFKHGYIIEPYWDGGALLLSRDGGATFAHVDTPDYDQHFHSEDTDRCLSKHGVARTDGTFAGDRSAHGTVVDLGPIEPEDQVVVRFIFGTDFTVVRPGWSIWDVQVGPLRLSL